MRGLREQLVERMQATGVLTDPAIARAFRVVPRHRFVPEVSEEQAYTDQVVPTKRDESGLPISSASQPSMVALMLRQLALRPGHRVLEVGAGTGYNAALLAELVGETGDVTTVDIDPDTVSRAGRSLTEVGYTAVRVRQGDGGHGVEEFAPYDRIVVTAGAADLPGAWWRQLVDDGLLVVPLALSGIDVSIAFRKQAGATSADDRLLSRSVLGCGFMPMRGGFAARGGRVELAGHGVHAVFGQERTVDTAGLRAALDDPAPLRPAGVSLSVGELRGLDLWLATTEPTFCWIELDADAVRAGVLTAPLRSPGGDGRAGALVDGDSFAVLSYDRAGAADDAEAKVGQGQDSQGSQNGQGRSVGAAPVDPSEGLDARVDLGVAGFGPSGPEMSNRLMAAIREWRQRGAEHPEHMRVLALPAGTPVSPDIDAHIIDKPHCRLVIRWR